MQDWDLAEARARHALEEVDTARTQVLGALGVQWRSAAGRAYRSRLEDCLRQLDAVPRELEEALAAIRRGRESPTVAGP
ncbi:hypothetical protein [Arthrobacter sp. JSM 101049]|uniref:hypothetical protein n=1 Tax=Arthrobacter sp. JSM 101049 TaxID=929097 RepID=UPI0035620363